MLLPMLLGRGIKWGAKKKVSYTLMERGVGAALLPSKGVSTELLTTDIIDVSCHD